MGGKTLGQLLDLHLTNLRHGPRRTTPATRDREAALKLLLETVGGSADRRPVACRLSPVACRLPPAACRLPMPLCSRICWPHGRSGAKTFLLADLAAPEVAAQAKRTKLPVIGLVNIHGDAVTRRALSTLWQTCIKAAILERVIFEADRFPIHDAKRKDVTETVGDKAAKKVASGHKSHSMLDLYDKSIPRVTTPGGV